MLEMLEKREMLAGDVASSWHNSLNPRDVNFDQRVTTSDLMVVVNELLRNGAHSLAADQATPLTSTTGASHPRYLDVNGDDRVSAADALMVVNALLTTNDMLISTSVTDLAGNPITEISVGAQYKLQTIVQDIRNPPNVLGGVFAAATKISYDSGLSTIDTGQTVQFGSFFGFTQASNLQQGQVVGWAVSNSFDQAPGTDPQFLFSVVLTASAAGVETFTPMVDDTDPNHENLLYGDDNPITAVQFEGTTLNIVALPGLSVGDVTQTEGNTDSTFNFTVQLSQASAEQTTVQYSTADGTATVAGNDYLATSGTLTFAPGQTTAVIPVTVKGDTNVEPDENFNVVLSNPSSNATIIDSTGIGTILNDDVQGSLSIVGSTVDNTTSGATGYVTVTLSQALTSAVTVQYATADSSALAGVDYVATSGTLTFNPGGSLTQTVPVSIIGDSTPDAVEEFFVNLSNPSANASLDVAQATIQINPAAVGILATITPSVSHSEGASGNQTPFVFTVSLSAAATEDVTVAYTTADITANAGSDYVATSGTLTFQAGVTSQTVTVQVTGDNVAEPSETFAVNFQAISGAVGSGQGIGTILDDDGTPTLIIDDVTVASGLGVNQATFTVTLTGALTSPVSVGYATSDGSAVAGTDYLTATGNLNFTPGGSTTKTITVTILSSSSPQPDKTFFVNLSSVTGGAVIGDDLGVGTIITQGISISDAVVVEGNSGTRDAIFTVSLSRQSNSEVTVAYSTLDGTATTADSDYVATNGILTFAPNSSTRFITVQVNGDTVQEANETFKVVLSNASGAPIFNSPGTGTILNDDGQKVTYLLQLTDTSGNALPLGTQFDVGAEFYLNVSVQDVQIDPMGVAQAFIDVSYNDALLDVDESSLEFGSFFTTFTSSDFQPGLLNDFGAFGDTSGPPANPGDPQLLYRVKFTATDVGLANFTGSVNEADLNAGDETLLYLNDSPVPSDQMSVVPLGGLSVNIGSNVITVADSSASEGAGQMVFTVTRFLPSSDTATVVYSTVDGTAIAGQDYTAQTGTLTFDAANTVRYVTVPVINDTIDEPDETFSLVLSSPQGAKISASAATGTILDDDNPPSVSVSGGSASEGDGVVFNISLSSISGKTVTVAYATTGTGTATSGLDYTPVSGTLTFAPGTTLQSVTVPTLGDIVLEGNETFQLALTSPTNATLGTAQANGTIVDVPPAGLSGYVYVDLNNNGIKDANESGIQGVIVTATNSLTGVSQSTTTKADGSYLLVGLIPGTYTLTETQPGFYTDGRDTRFGVDSPLNDQFAGIVLAPSAGETGFNFGEGGIRSDFITAFLNRRALFATAAVEGYGVNMNLSGTVLDLRTGDIWVSFDGGWSGLRQIDALFNSAQGTANMRLYNNNLQEVADSSPSSTGAVLLYNGTLGQTYFLRITGSNSNVTVQITEPSSFSNLASTGSQSSDTSQTSTGTSSTGNTSTSSSNTTYIYDRFGNPIPVASPSAEPLVSTDDGDGSDEAFADDEDWVLDSLLA